jgi:conjugal transfer pilus assembly protein TraV
MKFSMLLAATAAALLTGCSSLDLSGVGGDSEFACSAPKGVSCMSVTGLYINAQKGTLPGMQRSAAEESVQKPKGKSELPSAFGSNSETQEQGATQPGRAAKATDGRATASYGDTRDGSVMVSPASMETPQSGQPIRSAPKVLRVWMAPFQDTDNDLHDQRYVFVTVHTGRWLIEANQVNIQRQFKPVFQLGQRGGNKEDAVDGDEKAVVRKELAPGITDVPQRSAPGSTGQARKPGMN